MKFVDTDTNITIVTLKDITTYPILVHLVINSNYLSIILIRFFDDDWTINIFKIF